MSRFEYTIEGFGWVRESVAEAGKVCGHLHSSRLGADSCDKVNARLSQSTLGVGEEFKTVPTIKIAIKKNRQYSGGISYVTERNPDPWSAEAFRLSAYERVGLVKTPPDLAPPTLQQSPTEFQKAALGVVEAMAGGARPALQHTPGPWTVTDTGRRVDGPFGTAFGEGTQPIADVRVPNDSKNQRLANAKLIAAAPEMLDALKTIAGILDHQFTNGVDDDSERRLMEAHDAMKEVIAKVDGRDA